MSGKTALIRGYNARSTRPIWHWWRIPVATDDQTARALCGATANENLIDANVGHVRGCGKCDEKQRRLVQSRGDA